MAEHNLSLQNSSTSWGRIRGEATKVKADGNLEYPRIVFPLTLDTTPTRGRPGGGLFYSVLNIKGCLLLRDNMYKIADTFLNCDCRKYGHGNSTLSLDMEFPLDKFRIEKIEQVRQSDLTLKVELSFLLGLFESVPLPPPDSQQKKDILTEFDVTSCRLDFDIPESHWVKLLSAWGYSAVKILEIPTTSKIVGKGFTKAVEECEQAQQYLITGDYDKAVAHCRSAIEPIKNKLPELKKRIESDTEYAWVKEIGNATYDWIEKLYQKTRDLTSKAHHLPSLGHFSRHDAEAIILVTTALIAYAARLTEPTSKNGS